MKNYVENYPRPQLIRDSYITLDGIWDFSFDAMLDGENRGYQYGFSADKKITVPFTYETKASGINIHKPYRCVWYQRNVILEKIEDSRVIINFEGSDYITKLWVNGRAVGMHRGGYSRFSFDITDYVENGENLFVVSVEDSYDKAQPRGKQRWIPQNFDCFYVQTTGIWKSVWIEYVPDVYVTSLKLTPNISDMTLKIEGTLNSDYYGSVSAEVAYEGNFISSSSHSISGDRRFSFTVTVASDRFPWLVKYWTPDDPELYDLTIRLNDGQDDTDEIKSYFGMREISIKGRQILLNGKPLYQRLILDQGYWSDTHLTPPGENALKEDIDKIMRLGFNGVRKHMKVEDERFLYWADVKGLLVWSEFPATYIFCDDAVQNFINEWMEVVRQNYSHPSIITWTPFNESWGVPMIRSDTKQQNFTQAVYYLTKAFDRTRPVICNDGWEHTISDIITLHDYEPDAEAFTNRYFDENMILNNEISFNKSKYSFAEGFEDEGKPVIISEYGGIALDGMGEGWGYGEKVSDEDDFFRRFSSITRAIRELEYCCGYCYTQVSDVQQEVNGLMNERREFKIDPERVRAINEGLWESEDEEEE